MGYYAMVNVLVAQIIFWVVVSNIVLCSPLFGELIQFD